MIIYNGGPNLSLKEVVLFPFDDYSIPFQRGVRLQLASRQSTAEGGTRIVVPVGPVGTPDHAWISYYGAVCRVGNDFMMWYLGGGEDEKKRLCFATSRDGRHWEKPDLGLVEYNGNTHNNAVDLLEGRIDIVAATVLYDSEDSDPQRRFKLVFETHRRDPAHGGRAEFNVAISPDGLRWTELPVTPHDLSCEMSGITKFNGAYYVTAQSGGGHFGPPRKLETFVSYDFEHWTLADCLGFMRGNIPPRPVTYESHAGEQVHLGAGLWNRGNVIMGFYGMWHGHPTNDRRLVSIDLGFVVSNDALHYREPVPDFRIIAASEDGMADDNHLLRVYPALEQGQGFENIGDETLTWYGSWSGRDGVRVATWQRDRLGYFEPFKGSKMRSPAEAHFISAPLNLEGKPARVFVNAGGLSQYSQVTVEVLNERFEQIAGYTGAECIPLQEEGLRQPVRWQSGDLVAPTNAPVRLRVNVGGLRPEDIQIYALYVEEAF
ncbi:MAG: hypothetical protein EXR62_15395 [Chloroflexi bacterium]|nr:hypothetical protein [Chloroflexota bacterium]